MNPSSGGLRMYCKLEGHDVCSKSRKFSAAGSEDLCRRELKAWALWGRDSHDKSAHSSVWKKVLSAKKNDTLPSEADLDAAITAASAAPAVVPADSASAASDLEANDLGPIAF